MCCVWLVHGCTPQGHCQQTIQPAEEANNTSVIAQLTSPYWPAPTDQPYWKAQMTSPIEKPSWPAPITSQITSNHWPAPLTSLLKSFNDQPPPSHSHYNCVVKSVQCLPSIRVSRVTGWRCKGRRTIKHRQTYKCLKYTHIPLHPNSDHPNSGHPYPHSTIAKMTVHWNAICGQPHFSLKSSNIIFLYNTYLLNGNEFH